MQKVQFFGLLWLAAFSSAAQVQEAWVNRYNGGFTNLDHRPVALALDGSGNVYVAGSSQSTSSNYDYVVLKYAPDGMEVWTARCDSTNGGNATVNGFVLGQSGDAYVTGTGGTVKFTATGAVAWAAPYAGNGLAVDTNGNVYVTGFSTNDFATVKLDPSGSNVWLGTFNSHPGYPAASQAVGLDQAGNLYVAGWAGQDVVWGPPYFYMSPLVVKYDPAGAELWACDYLLDFAPSGLIRIKGLLFDSSGSVYLTGTGEHDYETAKVSQAGQVVWITSYVDTITGVSGMALDRAGNVYLTGGSYWTLKADSSTGNVIWQTYLLCNVASGLALDSAANVFVTGTTIPDPATSNDWMTIKYDNKGNQVWVKRYNGPANGDDGAVAIAVAPDGSIYVTGYSANTSGGTDITTIKYVQDPTIQPQPGGAMRLQLPGLPGSSAGLQATTNFTNWTELGPVVAGTNGLFQFTDTNAPLFPLRFYRWHAP